MAHKKRRRRRNPASLLLANPRRRHHRRRRHNPPGRALNARSITNAAIDGVLHGALVVGGKAGVRLVRRQFGYQPGSVVGSAVEAAAALALGLFGGRVLGQDKARSLMHGGFAAPIEAIVKSAKIPYVSDALGDAGLYDSQIMFLPADAGAGAALQGYASTPSSLSGYAAPTSRAALM